MNTITFTNHKYNLFTGSLDEILLTKKILINTINQYSYCIAEKDPTFKQVLLESEILLPDGLGVVFAYQLLTGHKITKIAGADLHNHLLTKLNQENKTCFYLGSSENTLEKIKIRLNKEFPNIKAGFYSPPYKAKFSEQENNEMVKAINEFQPDVVFVGMTAPKQECWAHKHKDYLETKLICTIGAVFDFYAGTIERPDRVWINLGLEWLGRLVKEPKRMWKRYLYYGPIFLYMIIKQKLSNKIPQ